MAFDRRGTRTVDEHIEGLMGHNISITDSCIVISSVFCAANNVLRPQCTVNCCAKCRSEGPTPKPAVPLEHAAASGLACSPRIPCRQQSFSEVDPCLTLVFKIVVVSYRRVSLYCCCRLRSVLQALAFLRPNRSLYRSYELISFYCRYADASVFFGLGGIETTSSCT